MLSVGAAAAACACVVVSMGALRAFDLRTDRLILAKEEALTRQTDSLQETYRKIGTKMGFNILILPKEQNLSDLYANDFASHFMPQWYVDTLARSKLLTIQHLLPTLQQKVKWTEEQRTIILVGTSGEVPLVFDASPKKPLRETVPPGHIILGYELHAGRGHSVGTKVRMLGRDFIVSDCYPERGSKDDITAWINLGEAQTMLDKKGLINGIMALECNCAMANVGMIRKEIEGILPQTQVIEFASQALARAESRRKAADYAAAALAQEQSNRQRMRNTRERFLSAISVAVMIVGGLCIGFLAFINMRDRRYEVGILRAVGLRTPAIVGLFIGRAVAAGLFGAMIGVICGLCAVAAGIAGRGITAGVFTLVNPVAAAAVLIGAPFFAAVACWIPALLAATQDPADILTRE
jgi:hypothetical protein